MDVKISHNNAAVDRLQKELREVEFEEERLKRELEVVQERKRVIIEELGKYSDEKYEQDMLELVYQQRQMERGKK